MGEWKNQLYYGDNLEVMRNHKFFPDESVDLIYLDPPFNSGRNYNVIFREKNGKAPDAQVSAFNDTWVWGDNTDKIFNEIKKSDRFTSETKEIIISMCAYLGKSSLMAYLIEMTPRLVEMKRILKDTGSIYLHCDPTASHYLKILMDAIFGMENFRNEIVWCYTGGGRSKENFAEKHDIILLYSKTDSCYFNADAIRVPYNLDPSKYDSPHGWGSHKGTSKIYKPNPKGKIPEDWWIISQLNSQAKERLGYPTQKPEELLERIIKASCPQDGIVLDPFCGCGTTVAVVERLGIKWIGIDVTYIAIGIIKDRLVKLHPTDLKPIEEHGIPKDVFSALKLAEQDKYEFQWWFTFAIGGYPYGDKKKGSDKGVDGWMYFDEKGKTKKCIISVKGGATGSADIRNLIGTLHNQDAVMGILLTAHEPTKEMKNTVSSAGTYTFTTHLGENIAYSKIQILSLKDHFGGKNIQFPRESTISMKSSEPVKKEHGKQTNLIL